MTLLTSGNVATESLYDNESIRRIMERHHEMTKEFRQAEFTKKLRKAKDTRSKGYEDTILKDGDTVFYQNKGKKAWLGPEKIFMVQKNSVYIFSNGSIKKVPRCNIQFLRRGEPEEEDAIDNDQRTSIKEAGKSHSDNPLSSGNSVNFDIGNEDNFGEYLDSEEIKELEKRKTRSMTAVERRELERDQMATFWLQMENTECFSDVTIFAVEVPANEHRKPEVVEAKDKELENLTKYDVFEEVEDTGQERIGSRWVITRKEKEDPC